MRTGQEEPSTRISIRTRTVQTVAAAVVGGALGYVAADVPPRADDTVEAPPIVRTAESATDEIDHAIDEIKRLARVRDDEAALERFEQLCDSLDERVTRFALYATRFRSDAIAIRAFDEVSRRRPRAFLARRRYPGVARRSLNVRAAAIRAIAAYGEPRRVSFLAMEFKKYCAIDQPIADAAIHGLVRVRDGSGLVHLIASLARFERARDGGVADFGRASVHSEGLENLTHAHEVILRELQDVTGHSFESAQEWQDWWVERPTGDDD